MEHESIWRYMILCFDFSRFSVFFFTLYACLLSPPLFRLPAFCRLFRRRLFFSIFLFRFSLFFIRFHYFDIRRFATRYKMMSAPMILSDIFHYDIFVCLLFQPAMLVFSSSLSPCRRHAAMTLFACDIVMAIFRRLSPPSRRLLLLLRHMRFPPLYFPPAARHSAFSLFFTPSATICWLLHAAAV